MPDTTLRAALEAQLGTTIKKVTALSGGDINEARLLHTTDGPLFLKFNSAPFAADMFEKEARGLTTLRQANCIRIPEVIARGQTDRHAWLVLEYLPQDGHASPKSMRALGEQLAALHQQQRPSPGLDYDNYIGRLPQHNHPQTAQFSFLREQRLRPQQRLAQENGLLSAKDTQQLEQLYERLPDLIPEEAAALLHGDLWSGNYLLLSAGVPALIDPAIAYGHRESDIAMTKLFGGFTPAFYEAYQATYPLSPGWQNRTALFQLYYLLVHLNLFGNSYLRSVQTTVRFYL